MVKRRLEDIEELVQASVFHPSPCRRLREQVLHTANRAQKREMIGKRTLLGASAALFIGMLVLILFSWKSSPPLDSQPAPPRPATETAPPPRPSSHTRAHWRSSTQQSLGEAFMRRATSTL